MESQSNPPDGGEAMAAISNGLVALHRKYYGKGPEQAKTYFVDHTVVCVLRGGFGTVERTMIDEGRVDAVRDLREGFQRAKRAEFEAVVEQATGQRVVGYVCQVHVDPDLAVEMFFLDPSG